jgi:hypothetical protein
VLMSVSFCNLMLTVQERCLDNGMKLNISKTTLVTFTRKANSINYNYKLCNQIVTRSRCLIKLGILLDCKLHSHSHVGCIFS